MIMRLLTVTAVLGLSACATVGVRPLGNDLPANPAARITPQPAVLTAKERLVGAIEANGCALTAENVGTVLTQATISREELITLTPQLQAEGRVETAGDGAIRVTSDRCI